MMAKPFAFFLRDLRSAASYRLTFLVTLGGILISLLTLQLTSRLVVQGKPEALAPFGNDYFTFALIGASIALFSQSVANSFPATIRSAQVTGTLEVLLGTRTTLGAFLIFSSLYAIAFAVIQLFGGLIVGQVVLGAHLRLDQALLAVSVLLLTTAIFAAIGILGAAFVIRYKQREPLTRIILTGSFLVSGIIYPTSVLPGWLEPLAPLMPLTYSARALRSAMLEGAATSSLTHNLLPLAAFALLLPISLAIFSYSVHRARVVGSLAQY